MSSSVSVSACHSPRSVSDNSKLNSPKSAEYNKYRKPLTQEHLNYFFACNFATKGLPPQYCGFRAQKGSFPHFIATQKLEKSGYSKEYAILRTVIV